MRLTGPIRIDGAEPGDVLEINVLQVEHRGWGWSSVLPGLGFLKDQFRDPYIFHWTLDPRLAFRWDRPSSRYGLSVA